MDRPKSAHAWLLGLGLGALLALWLAPATRWLVRAQTITTLFSRDTLLAPPAGRSDAAVRYAQDHPDDYGVQYALALNAPPETDTVSNSWSESWEGRRVARLRALETRFPNQTPLYAAVLRYALAESGWLISPADWALIGKTPPLDWDKDAHPPAPADLAAFDRDAAIGERLDPDNAYFPFLRSIGLFTAHREAEAVAALERAGSKPIWRDYGKDEVEALWHAQEIITGGQEAIGRTAIAAGILLPQYSKIRALARLIVYKAMLAERAGRPQEGLALRRALLHCALVMQTQSTYVISSLVAIAIGSIATNRPGGGPPAKFDSRVPSEQRAQERVDAFCAYAQRLGREAVAREARQQYETGTQIRALLKSANLEQVELQPLYRLMAWLAADLVVLANVILLLLCGGFAALATRVPRLRDGHSLGASPVVVWTLLLLILAVVASVLALTRPPDSAGPFLVTCLLLAGLTVGIVTLTRLLVSRRLSWPSLRHSLWVGGGVLLCVALFLALAAWQARSVGTVLTVYETLFQVAPDTEDAADQWANITYAALCLVAVSIAPLLTLLVLAVVSRMRRVPLAAGLAHGLRRNAVAVAGILLLLYGGLVLATLRREQAINATQTRSLQHEGRYLASIVGKPWPETTP